MVSDLLPVEILTIIDAISTAVLAVITYFYAKETGLIRKSAQHPSFSLEPTIYTFSTSKSDSNNDNDDNNNNSDPYRKLSLINNGLPANDIRVDCWWGEGDNAAYEGTFKNKKFYVMSLHTQGNAILDGVPIAHIVNNEQHLLVNLVCKDSRGETYTTKFDIDFRKIGREDRKVAYQYEDNSIQKKE